MKFKRFSSFRIDQSFKVDANGFLRVAANATRVGVFKYRGPNGELVKEFRPPEEVFSEDSMQSLAYIPVTNDHPTEGQVNPKNAAILQVGQTGHPYKEEPFLATEVVITREDAIQTVQNGKQELSCGYNCELEWTPGVYNDESYDCIQRKIRYNHLAIVDRGRAGPQVRLKLDKGDAEEVNDADEVENLKPQGGKMKVKIGDKEFEVADECGKAMMDEMAKKDGEIAALKDMGKGAKKDADTLQAKLDDAEAKLKERQDAAPSEEAIKARVDARIAVLKAVDKVELPKEFKVDEASDLEIKKAVLKAHRPSIELVGKSDTYVDVAFDLACDELSRSESTRTEVGAKIINGGRQDATDVPDSAARRKQFIQDSEKAWQS